MIQAPSEHVDGILHIIHAPDYFRDDAAALGPVEIRVFNGICNFRGLIMCPTMHINVYLILFGTHPAM